MVMPTELRHRLHIYGQQWLFIEACLIFYLFLDHLRRFAICVVKEHDSRHVLGGLRNLVKFINGLNVVRYSLGYGGGLQGN